VDEPGYDAVYSDEAWLNTPLAVEDETDEAGSADSLYLPLIPRAQ
jgi:hypothetical protein